MRNQFIFAAGAPGSMWSRITGRIKRNFYWIDRSDDTEERRYKMPEGVIESRYTSPTQHPTGKGHYGSYFGPGNEFGEHFDDIKNNYTIDEFRTECLKPFTDDTRPTKIVRSHWFAYQLDWLYDNMKNEEILLVWREADKSRDWWYGMGGWNINHPNYDWYQNDTRMWEKIQEETILIKEFGDKHNVTWIDYDVDDNWILKLYPDPVTKVPNYGQFFLTDPVKVALFKIE